MATAQTQFFKSIILIGGNPYPCQPTCSLTVPKNFIVPMIIGNNWQFNYAEGLQQPVVDVNLVVRDVAGEVLGSTFLNYFLTRTSDAAFDTSAIASGLDFWDGRTGFNMAGVKADSFSISGSKGQPIQMTARFCGTSISALGSAPTFTSWNNKNLLTFKHVNFAGALADIVWQFGISYANNHTPDLSLNGTNYAAAQNAGVPTAGLNIMVQAADSAPNNNPVPVSLTAIQASIVGANVTRNLILNNAIDNTENNRAVGAGRVMRPHSYQCLGADGNTTGPLSIS